MKPIVLLLAVTPLVACILQDREIEVINEDIQNKQAVRIVEPIQLSRAADEACVDAANEADEGGDRIEICPQPGIGGALTNFLDPKIPAYNFCACDPGERHKPLRESTLYVEDRDDRRKEGPDPIYAAIQLDLAPDSPNPHLYVRYDHLVNPYVNLSLDDQINYRPVKRPDPKVRQLKLGAGDDVIDPCNDVDPLDQPLSHGYHTMRLIVTDREWFTDPDGKQQPGVPDLSAGATFDTRTYVFHCNTKTVDSEATAAAVTEADRCKRECTAEDGG